jgi:hypothetical protein
MNNLCVDKYEHKYAIQSRILKLSFQNVRYLLIGIVLFATQFLCGKLLIWYYL